MYICMSNHISISHSIGKYQAQGWVLKIYVRLASESPQKILALEKSGGLGPQSETNERNKKKLYKMKYIYCNVIQYTVQ